jgi:tetratricopeptide (TPR) repeat protein
MAEFAESPEAEITSRGEAIALDIARDKVRRRPRKARQPSPEDAFLAAEGRKLELEMHHLRLSHFDRLLTVALKLVTAAFGLLVATGLAFMVVAAARADSVVVDAFQTPAALGADGLNGTVLASKLLDRLQMLQAQTQTASAHRGIKDAWSNDIKVEVPETGVSIGELEHYLHAWLGHEIHVGGDLETEGDTVRLTVRGAGFEARTFEGPRKQLAQLVSQAAEYIYGEAEPYLAAAYLEAHGRDAEAVALMQAKYPAASPRDRPFLLNAWGIGLGDLGRSPESLAKYAEALRLKPDYWVAYSNTMAGLWGMADEEGAWRSGMAMAKAADRGAMMARAPAAYFQPLDNLTWNLGALQAGLIADVEKHGGVGSNVIGGRPLIADTFARMHDPQGAELYLETSADAAASPWVSGMTHFVHGWEALDRGDWARAAAELEAFDAAYANPLLRSEVPGYDCWLAPAEEMAGRPAKADAALAAGGRYVDCYRFRGDILDHRGDWPGAQKAYAAAAALAPDLPAAYYSWGLALARRGDLNGAMAKYAAAHQRGPHWADPLKAWGDALAAQGRWAQAKAKYEEAAPFAPRWPALAAAGAAARRHSPN